MDTLDSKGSHGERQNGGTAIRSQRRLPTVTVLFCRTDWWEQIEFPQNSQVSEWQNPPPAAPARKESTCRAANPPLWNVSTSPSHPLFALFTPSLPVLRASEHPSLPWTTCLFGSEARPSPARSAPVSRAKRRVVLLALAATGTEGVAGRIALELGGSQRSSEWPATEGRSPEARVDAFNDVQC